MFRFRFRFLALVVLVAVTTKTTLSTDNAPVRCPRFDANEIERFFNESSNVEAERIDLEQTLLDEGKIIKPTKKVADISHLRQTNEDPLNRDKELKQIIFEAVSEKIAKKYRLNAAQINECLPKIPLNGEFSVKAKTECHKFDFSCQCDDGTEYRSYDGTCNNLDNPTWGAVGSCFVRTLPPRYVDINGFRQSAAGGDLPEPRDLSLNVHNHLNKPTRDLSHMYVFFGQLIDHEITQAPISITLDNLAIQCCVSGELHPQCTPIAIRTNDTFYSEFGTTCINVVRAALCPTCTLGPRQQINQITAFVDASVVYGTNYQETLNLRANDGTGRLRVQKSAYGDLLPPSPNPETDQCSYIKTNEICFQAGDPRANEHAPLSSLQTIFLREHNRLADGLKKQNPSWDDEKLFQEARKILGAEMQVVVYKEYLPLTLGDELLDKYQLRISQRARTEYEDETNPSITNSFTAAAFRFSHSLINEALANTPLNSTGQPRLLRDQYFQPFDLYKGILSPLMEGVVNSPAQEFDRHLVTDVTDFLYRIRGTPAGLDLASINIRRGRDHGIPTYADMVRYCTDGNSVLRNFRDLTRLGLISQENQKLLSQNYKRVDDIDLWTGLLSEIPVTGAVVGPTTACIVGSQFRGLKFGDRFYFEHKKESGSFNYKQLQDLKKITLSQIMCLNTNITSLPQNALLQPSNTNKALDCSKVKGVNLSLWKGKTQ